MCEPLPPLARNSLHEVWPHLSQPSESAPEDFRVAHGLSQAALLHGLRF